MIVSIENWKVINTQYITRLIFIAVHLTRTTVNYVFVFTRFFFHWDRVVSVEQQIFRLYSFKNNLQIVLSTVSLIVANDITLDVEASVYFLQLLAIHVAFLCTIRVKDWFYYKRQLYVICLHGYFVTFFNIFEAVSNLFILLSRVGQYSRHHRRVNAWMVSNDSVKSRKQLEIH